MPTLHLICGLPCSGKTTLAKQLEHTYSALRLTPDEWHTRLFGQDLEAAEHDDRHNLIETMLWDLAARVLGLGINVILDFGFWAQSERDDYRSRAAGLGASSEVHFLNVSQEVLLERLATRNARLPWGAFSIPEVKLKEWILFFQPPTQDELERREVDMYATHPTSYPELNAVLLELVSSARAILKDNFTAAYLQGSLARKDPDEHGDVDFIIVTEGRVNELEFEALQTMHLRLNDLDSYWAKHLEGSYFPKDVLRRYDPNSEPVVYIDNGSRQLLRHKHDDTLVVRWVLRDHAIILAGPDAKTLIDEVSTQALQHEVSAVMQEWANEIFAEPERVNNGWYQPYAVLSYCRMLQTLQTGRVESKRSAIDWGIENLDERWKGLIQRAWAERPDQYAKGQHKANPDDFVSTLKFIRYALELRSSL
jgi:predicted kinase/predicted nucleotidyltransferase